MSEIENDHGMYYDETVHGYYGDGHDHDDTSCPMGADNKDAALVWELSEEAQGMLNDLIDQLADFCEANKLPLVVAAQIEQAADHATGYLFFEGNMEHTHSPMMLHLATVARILLNTDMDVSLDYLNALEPVMEDFIKRHPKT